MLNIRDRVKRRAISEIKRGFLIELPYQKLWFSVLERAILDIGLRNPKVKYKKHKDNSDWFFLKPTFRFYFMLDCIGLEKEYLFMVLKKHHIWPLPTDYYTY